jgi:cytochrome c556
MALAGAAMLLVTAVATAHARAPDGPDGHGIVSGREAGMRMSGAIMGGIKGSIDRDDDPKTQANAAKALLSWANALPGMFPDGSNIAPTEALPAVWSDKAGFGAKAAAFSAAVTKLSTAAAASDKPGFAAAFAEVRGACSDCHTEYKS